MKRSWFLPASQEEERDDEEKSRKEDRPTSMATAAEIAARPVEDLEAVIFWESYCQMEYIYQPHRLNSLFPYFEVLRRFFDQIVYHASPSPSVRPTNSTTSKSHVEMSNDRFAVYFQSKTMPVCISVISINIFSLCFLFATILTRKYMFPHTMDGNRDILIGYDKLVLYIIPWVVFNGAVLLYFLAIKIYGYKALQAKVNMLDIWHLIGYSLFYSRCYLVLTTLLRYFMEGHVCYGYPLEVVDAKLAAYFYVFLFTIDAYQLAVTSVIPFPWPTPFYLFLIVSVEQLLRIFTCAGALFPDETSYNTIKGCICAILLSMTAVAVIHPIGFERSMRFSYLSVQEQNKAAQEKMNLVNMLCRDIKAPAQQFIQIFKSLEPLLVKAPIEMQSYLSSLQVLSSTINLVVDDLLFLVRVEEGRFRFACQDVVNVKSSLKRIYSTLVSTSMQGSVSFVNESMFDSHVRMDTITTDKNCFQVLMYYSVIAAVDSYSSLRTSAGRDAVVSRIEVTIALNEEQADAAQVTIRASGKRSNTLPYNLNLNVDKDSFLESCCIICKKVSRTFNGNWSLTKEGVRFNIRIKAPSKADISIPSESSFRWDRINAPLHSTKNSQLPRLITIPECCVFITDSSLQHLVTDIVHQLPGGFEIVIHNQVSTPVLKLYQVVFVQSIRACIDVREKGFNGKIVLCSERLTYIDDLENSHFDYGLSLPCSETTLHNLVSWLSEQVYITNRTLESTKSKIKFQPSSFAFIDDMLQCLQPIAQQLLNPGNLSTDVYESFLRWKYIAPPGSVFHPAHRIDLVCLLCSATALLALMMKVVRIRNFFSMQAVLMLIISTKYICSYTIARANISLHRWWTSSNVLFMIVVILYSISEYYYFDNTFKWHKIDRSHLAHKSFADFLTKNSHGPCGSEFIFYLCYSFGFSSFFSDFICYPISSAVTFVQVIRCIFMIQNIFSYYVEPPLVRFLTWLIISLGILIILIQYHHERILRLQFLDLYELMQSRKLLDTCLCSSRESLSQPILRVKAHYEKFLNLVLQHCVDESLFLKPQIISSMLTMKGLNQTYEEQITSLFATDTSMFTKAQAKKTNELIRQMKVYYVKHLVREVCTSLSAMYMDHLSVIAGPSLCNTPTIRIFLQLHPALSVIRVDKQFFCALVSNTCRIAIERIQEGIQHHNRERGYQHQVLIWIEPSTKQSVQRFTDVRVMEVTVFDTSEVVLEEVKHAKKKFGLNEEEEDESFETFLVLDNTELNQAKKSHRASKLISRPKYKVIQRRRMCHMKSLADSYSFGISSKFMELFNLPVIAEAGFIDHPIYNSFQKIGIPYMLCTDSHKFEQWISIEKSFVIGIEQSSRWKAFHRYFSSYNVRLDTNNFSRLQDLPNSFQRKKTRKSRGLVHLLCNARSTMRYSFNSVGEEFKHLQWSSQVIYSDSLPLDQSIYACDCMVIDESIVIKHTVPMSCRDLINYIYAHDFAGIVVVVKRINPYDKISSNDTDDAKFLQCNPYIDAAQADLYFELPINTSQVKSIIERSEIKNIFNLIS